MPFRHANPTLVPALLLPILALATGCSSSSPTPSGSVDAGAEVDASIDADAAPPDTSAPDVPPVDSPADSPTDKPSEDDAAGDGAPDAPPDSGAEGGIAPGGWLALIGGGAEGDIGDDTAWSAYAYEWIVEHANHGKIAIVAADPQSDFLASYFTWLGAASVVDLTIGSTAQAEDPQNLEHLAEADAIFLKGGDQWSYLSAWTGSEVPGLLEDAVTSGRVLAGTSAGAHVIGSVVYDARNGSVRLGEAVRDPWDSHITFTHDFSSVLPHVLVDTHFTQRGRLARLAPMFVRLLADPTPKAEVAIGIDDRTALLVDPQGHAEVRGEGSVSLLYADASTQVAASAGTPPLARDLRLDVLGDGYSVDLTTRQVTGHPSDAVVGSPGALPMPPGPALLSGSDPAASQAGTVSLLFDHDGDLYDGEVSTEPGDGIVPGFVVAGNAFSQAQIEMAENRVGGVQWVLSEMADSVPMGLLLDEGAEVAVASAGRLEPQPVPDEPAVVVLDGRALEETASTPYLPRQSVSLIGLRLHLLRSGESLDW